MNKTTLLKTEYEQKLCKKIFFNKNYTLQIQYIKNPYLCSLQKSINI